MTTYRERRERRADRREDWAGKRQAKSAAAFDRADEIASNIPLGQPILVGHHSERHARRDQARIESGMRAGVEHQKMAEHHQRSADTIRRQLDTSIYRDDTDEVDRLEAKLAGLEGRRARMRAVNSWVRRNMRRFGFRSAKGHWNPSMETAQKCAELLKAAGAELSLVPDEGRELRDAWTYNGHIGFPPYALSNLGGSINRVKKRLPEARERAEQRARVREALAVEGER